MEFKHTTDAPNPNEPRKEGGLRNLFKGVVKSLIGRDFIESGKAITSHLSNIKGIEMAVVTMDISRKSFAYEIVFSSIYKQNGKVFQTKNFHVIECPEEDLPTYLIEAVERDGGKTTVTFSKEDLTEYFDERDVKIKTSVPYDAILKAWDKSQCERIALTDRVFYTRLDFLDSTGREIGSVYVGRISGLPNELIEKVYPFGRASCQKSAEEN